MFLKIKNEDVVKFFSNLIKKLEKIFILCYSAIKCNCYKREKVSNENRKYRLTK